MKTALAAGVLIDASGLVATNKHNVGTRNKVTVRFSDTSEVEGKLVRSFAGCDLAFIKADIEGNVFTNLGVDSDIRVGQRVFAIGHPSGLENTLTQGIARSPGDRTRGDWALCYG
jgi:serine protease Do